jgi:hypothetical protein
MVTSLVSWRYRHEGHMNKTMNSQKRASSRTQRVPFPSIARMFRVRHLVLYRAFEHQACGIYSLPGSILRVFPFSAHMLVPPATSFVLFDGL